MKFIIVHLYFCLLIVAPAACSQQLPEHVSIDQLLRSTSMGEGTVWINTIKFYHSCSFNWMILSFLPSLHLTILIIFHFSLPTFIYLFLPSLFHLFFVSYMLSFFLSSIPSTTDFTFHIPFLLCPLVVFILLYISSMFLLYSIVLLILFSYYFLHFTFLPPILTS
jgi:hypothetical protein